MAITIDSKSVEARYAKPGTVVTHPDEGMPELYAPGMNIKPNQQGGLPQGTPVPEGVIIQQVVGRGMSVVPPQQQQPPGPQVAVIPPQHSSRTTIGTIVEPSKTNPLTVSSSGAVVINQKLPEPELPAEPQPLKPKRDLDLAKMILEHIWEMGGAKSKPAQEFYERSHDTLEKWMKQPGTIPLSCVMKFINRTPGVKADILDELEPHFEADIGGWVESLPNRTKTSVIVCAPVLERPTLPFMWTCLYLAKKYELGFDVMADTVIHRSRNMLAHRFLNSGATWSLWLDSDMAAPIKNPQWYKWISGAMNVPEEYTSYDVLERLLASGKAIIGGVYASRKFRGQLVMQPEIRPRHHEDKLLCNEIRRGSARGIHDVDWIGFGCALVHREVFLEVQRQFPDLAPEAEFTPWRFFQPQRDEGEDEAFCRRVKQCQIPIWLDTQLVCPHLGTMAFMPEMTSPRPDV
jgi:hypothetical protein